MYVKDVTTSTTVTYKEPEIVKETAGTAYVNGNNVLGEYVC